MALTRLEIHENCKVRADLVQTGPHYARLYCCDCHKHIQWLTWWDYIKIQKILEQETIY